jgi:hypothetical protein
VRTTQDVAEEEDNEGTFSACQFRSPEAKSSFRLNLDFPERERLSRSLDHTDSVGTA